MGESEAATIRQPRDRLTGQPQERQHSAAKGGTRDRLPPARGSIFTCARDRHRPAETRRGSGRSLEPGSAKPNAPERWRHNGALRSKYGVDARTGPVR